jgi:hypothetical protein
MTLLIPFRVLHSAATISYLRSFIHCMTPHRLILPHFVALAFAWIYLVPASAEIQHVIAISVDGLRGDFLQSFVDTAPTEFPNFVRLRNSGASTYHARCDYDFSETVPNHISMITGRPVSQPVGFADTWHHGVTSNSPPITATIHANGNPAVPYKASIFDVAHDRGLSTALFLGKIRLSILDRSFDGTNGALDVIGADNGRDKIDFLQMQDGNTPTLISTLVGQINAGPRNFTFLHITDPDTAGHASGWNTTIGGAYRNSIKTVDGYLGSIFTALDGQPLLSGRVAILLTGDHGGGGGVANNHLNATLPENYTIPFFLVAPGVTPGSDLYSVYINRYHPGSARPTFAAPEQPARNTDIANLSALLLGLPNVPGSLAEPELKKPLNISRTGNEFTLTWPRYLTDWSLQVTSDLVAGAWQNISAGITELSDSFAYTAVLESEPRFYRLRRPTDP